MFRPQLCGVAQWVAALGIQRVLRGFFGRLTYRRKILKRSEDIFMQVSVRPRDAL